MRLARVWDTMGIKELSKEWLLTEIGGGEGTKDGEWLSVERVPTTVHVELLEAGRIPDPVSRGCCNVLRSSP